MKSLIIALFAVTVSCSALAQTQMADSLMDNMSAIKMRNCVMMKDSKMISFMDGKTTPMIQPITMKNGTIVMTDGTVKMKDGKIVILKEGQCVLMNGKVKTVPKDEM